jgi:hypothetical protein
MVKVMTDDMTLLRDSTASKPAALQDLAQLQQTAPDGN